MKTINFLFPRLFSKITIWICYAESQLPVVLIGQLSNMILYPLQ